MNEAIRLRLKNSEDKALSLTGFFSMLLHGVTQAHVLHLQSKSFSEHKALGEFYDGLQDLADSIIESYQGTYGIVKGYEDSELYENESSITCLEKMLRRIELDTPTLFQDSDLLNQVDEIKTLLRSTLYKLKNLK